MYRQGVKTGLNAPPWDARDSAGPAQRRSFVELSTWANRGATPSAGDGTMAADNDMQVHRATYDKVINVMKYGAVAVFIIAFVVIAVLRETVEGERRVAATPETVKKFLSLGASVAVEAGAGETASIADGDYAAVGATVADRVATLAGAEIVLGVQGPSADALAGVAPGAWLVAGLNPFADRARIDGYVAAGLEALAMEFMPRITR
eukprot:gene31993-36729_t